MTTARTQLNYELNWFRNAANARKEIILIQIELSREQSKRIDERNESIRCCSRRGYRSSINSFTFIVFTPLPRML